MRKKHWWILPALAILVVLTLIALDERLTLRTYTVASPKLTAEVRLAVVTDFRLIMRTTWWRWLLPVRRMLCCWLEICSMTTSPIVRRSGRYR